MILTGAKIALGAAESARFDIGVESGRVTFTPRRGGVTLDLRGYMVLPGLINAHDHLEFNLFPRLGRGPYRNAAAWAADIYRPAQPPISRQLRLRKQVRLYWGGIKNLLSGVTCVMHHNPYQPEVFERDFPVRVVRRYGWAHSLAFAPDLVACYAATPPGAPYVLHACEGTDAGASSELRSIDAARLLGPSTVIVHGVALDRGGIGLMHARRASVVWCPSSNAFTLGRTISPELMGSGIAIALGTDSALTADGDMIDELRAALRHAGPVRVFDMVTRSAAEILRLGHDAGAIRHGGPADLVVVRDPGARPADALHAFDPELVIVGGRIKLSSPAMAGRLGLQRLRLQPIHVQGRGIRLIGCDAHALARFAAAALGEDFSLAGKRVAA